MNYDHGIRGDSCSYTARDPVQGTTISGTACVTPRPVYIALEVVASPCVCFFFLLPRYYNNTIIIIVMIMIIFIVQYYNIVVVRQTSVG